VESRLFPPPTEDLGLHVEARPIVPADDEVSVLQNRNMRIILTGQSLAIHQKLRSERIPIGVEQPRLDRAAAAILCDIVRDPADNETSVGKGGDVRGVLRVQRFGIYQELGPDLIARGVEPLSLDRRIVAVLGGIECAPDDNIAAVWQRSDLRRCLVEWRIRIDGKFRTRGQNFARKLQPPLHA
jgi:hypothetical protein